MKTAGIERLEPRALLAVTVPPDITSDTVELDDDVLVAGTASIEATKGSILIFGNSRGRIDAVTPGTGSLALTATGAITVTGAIGAQAAFDSLTLQSSSGQPVSLQQAVALDDDLTVTKAGSFTVGSTLDVGDDLTITDATSVLFAGNVNVAGDLTITSATSVTFAGTLTVGGQLTIVNATGTTRFTGDVSVGGASVTSTTLVQVLGGFTSSGTADTDGDVTFTANQVNFTTASVATTASKADASTATLVIRPRDATRGLTIASPPGIPTGLSITDADIAAIQSGWKRVVFGDEVAGTGAVRIGSIGSQYGGYSQLLNTTTVVGGSIDVVQPIDVTTLADFLELVARGTGASAGAGITIDAPINQTAEERNGWIRLISHGPVTIKDPIWATSTVSITTTGGGTVAQAGGAAAIDAPNLAVDADGAVTIVDPGNSFTTLAIRTTNDDVVLVEHSGYDIGEVATTDSARDVPVPQTVAGLTSGTAVVRLVTSNSTVTQTKPLSAGSLGLEGTKGTWSLSHASNDIGTIAADTGSLTFVDVDDLTVGTVAAVPTRAQLEGIVVSAAVDLAAATTLTLAAAGDIASSATAGKAVNLSGATGIATDADVKTAGGDVAFNQVTKLGADVVIDVSAAATGVVTFAAAVEGTKSGTESLTVAGKLIGQASLGGTTALESLTVSGTAALAAGSTIATSGNQTYGGAVSSAGSVTFRAAASAVVHFKDDVALGGLVTSAVAYDLSLTGPTVTITSPVTFLNTGIVTLGDDAADTLTFDGGLTCTVPATTKLAGTIATSDDDATFGAVVLTQSTTVSTQAGKATFLSSVNGARALVVNASGTTRFGGEVGVGEPLASLVTDAAGTTELAGGSVVTSGDQTYGDAVALAANSLLIGSTVTTLGTLSGDGKGLFITGKAVFGDDPGDTVTGLSNLQVSGAALINAAQVTGTGMHTYKSTVTLGTDVALQAGNVLFEASIAGGGHDLRVTGGVALGDADTDGVTGIDDLTIVGGTMLNANTVTTTGSQTYDGTVTIAAATAPVLTAAGVEFKQAVERGVLELVPSLTIAAGGGGVTFAGQVGDPVRRIGVLDVDSAGVVAIGAAIHTTGPVTIDSTAGSITGSPTNAIHAVGSLLGTIALQAATGIGSLAAPIGIAATSVTAETAKGGIYLRGVGSPGNLLIGPAGLKAPGAIDLSGTGVIGVAAGGNLVAGGGVTVPAPIHWSVDTTADSAPGSLRQVLLNVNAVGNANASGLDARILFDGVSRFPAETVFALATPLPEIRAAVEISSFAGIVLDGNRTVDTGLVFRGAGSGSTLQGLTLRSFTGYGIQLVGARGVAVDSVRVQSLRTSTSMGLYATGDLKDTKITNSTFSGGLRGALLDGARNLVFGAIGQGNLFTDSRAAPTQPKFSGTGVRAQGDCTGTAIAGNVFTANNYGVGLVNASGLRITGNQFTRNTIAGIYVEGRNLGSTQSGNTFGTGVNRNKTNILRFRNGRIG